MLRNLGLLVVLSVAACAQQAPIEPVALKVEPEAGDVYDVTGTASWYGNELAGNPTASGVPFDPNALTAAHPDLPFGTKVKVTNLGNGLSVTVEINDRGPFADNRIIDLSRAAANELGFIDAGTTEVRIEAVAGQGV